MAIPSHLQHIQLEQGSIDLMVPDTGAIRELYRLQKENDVSTPFPYWSKLWPSAIAISNFINRNQELVLDKEVLELAAGLGLPSLVAARLASRVTCSDYLPEAVKVIQESIDHHSTGNMEASLLDWNDLPSSLQPDVLLLSDINYEPEQFRQLLIVLKRFIEKGTIILLSTPQRLMAKPFIEQLMPWCCLQEECLVQLPTEKVAISLFLLKKQDPANHQSLFPFS